MLSPFGYRAVEYRIKTRPVTLHSGRTQKIHINQPNLKRGSVSLSWHIGCSGSIQFRTLTCLRASEVINHEYFERFFQ
ncbi:MAG: hypothetical protein DMF72_08395 [Acidobacteria bacterium]|nr:MAG: hypothetical protein DMF72_08395 [Acidobacteriota bacterium]